MRQLFLIFPFILSLFSLLFSTIFFPNMRLIAFAPFLAIAFHRKSFLASLWIAAGCGLILDLFSIDTRLGFFALCYGLCAGITHRFKDLFFIEKVPSFCCYTVLISFVCSLLQFFMLSLFHASFSMNFSAFLTNFMLMPLLDGLYAFFWFSCPMMLYTLFTKKPRQAL